MLLVGVRFVHRNMEGIFPQYMQRELGPESTFGAVLAINPSCVIVTLPLITILFLDFPAVKMIWSGAVVASVSPLVLAAGHSYTTSVAFVTVLSLGEAVWCPRLFEYTMSMAPTGREGTFMALAATPTLLASGIYGSISHAMLEALCPEHGERRSELMWLAVSSVAILSATVMGLLIDVIEPPGARVPIPRKMQMLRGHGWGAHERMEIDPSQPWHKRVFVEAKSWLTTRRV